MTFKMADEPARIPLGECPWCGHKLDAASHVSEPGIFAEPHPGDFNVCINCGGWLRFGSGMKLRRVNEQDILVISNEEHEMLTAITKAVRAIENQRAERDEAYRTKVRK